MSVLRLLAECGRVSRRTFDILPFSYRNTCVYIKKLVDSRGVSLSGKGSTKSYILLDHGRKTLSAYNPQRYTPELFELNKLLIRHADRSRLRGDVAAIMSLSGFAVHPDDKPTLPVNTPQPPDLQYASLRSLYKSTQPFQYGQIIPNRATYTEHLTPANCYYDSVQIKYLRQTATDKGINYRASMLLEVYGYQTYIRRSAASSLWVNDIRDFADVGEERQVEVVALERDPATGVVTHLEVSIRGAEDIPNAELRTGNTYTGHI